MPKKTEVVRIKNNAVDKNPVQLSIGQGDDMEWESQDDPYTITFSGKSPFKQSAFNVPANGRAQSGAIVAGQGSYHYEVARKGAAAADPDVDIVP